MLVADGIFHQVGRVFLNQPAAAEGVGVLEALVEVDAPVAGGAEGLTNFFGFPGDLKEAGPHIPGAGAGIGRMVRP